MKIIIFEAPNISHVQQKNISRGILKIENISNGKLKINNILKYNHLKLFQSYSESRQFLPSSFSSFHSTDDIRN